MRTAMQMAASGRWSLGLLGVLTIGVACSAAEAAPIPVTTPGQILNVSGAQYELAADLFCPAGLGLKIVADGIQFDGKGHTLTGPGAVAPGKNVGILVQGVKGVGVRLYIEAAGDIDRVAAGAKASGITLTKEPHDTEWGSRAFEVTEPSGFLLTIASRPST